MASRSLEMGFPPLCPFTTNPLNSYDASKASGLISNNDSEPETQTSVAKTMTSQSVRPRLVDIPPQKGTTVHSTLPTVRHNGSPSLSKEDRGHVGFQALSTKGKARAKYADDITTNEQVAKNKSGDTTLDCNEDLASDGVPYSLDKSSVNEDINEDRDTGKDLGRVGHVAKQVLPMEYKTADLEDNSQDLTEQTSSSHVVHQALSAERNTAAEEHAEMAERHGLQPHVRFGEGAHGAIMGDPNRRR